MRRDRLYLTDIVEACAKIERYTSGVTFEQFSKDEVLIDAVVRNLQNIGEAVRSLPDDTRQMRADIEWSRIVGMRNLLVHHYFGVDEEIIWDLATNRCPQLKIAATDILARISP